MIEGLIDYNQWLIDKSFDLFINGMLLFDDYLLTAKKRMLKYNSIDVKY